MELTNEQKKIVAQWVSEGLGLSDIQKRLTSDFGLKPTFMDVRFMVLDLGLAVKDKATKVEKPKAPPAAEADDGDAALDEPDALPGQGIGGAVSVEVDRIMKPGSLVSGTVKFSDGVSATWMLDEMGRLGLGASKPGYKPSQQDIQAFQIELKKVLERQGF